MDQNQYLEELDRLLSSLPYDQRRQIMFEYEKYFKEGLENNMTQEEIIAELEIPSKIAAKYVSSLVVIPEVVDEAPREEGPKNPPPGSPTIKHGNDIGKIVALSIMALIFNGLFLGFYLGYWAILIAFTVVGIVLVFGGVALLISAIFAAPISILGIPLVLFQYPFLLFAGSIIMICIGGLMLIVLFYLIKFTCILTYRYIKWLISVIRGF